MERRQFICFVATAALGAIPGRADAIPAIGRPAPEFSLPLFDGSVVFLKDFRGRPILINFFNSG